MLEQLYTVVYGEPPVGVRSWSEGGAVMLLLRLAGPAPFGGFQPDQPEQPGMLPYAAIPELVAAAVRVQTGAELGVGTWTVEADLGLVMFVFRPPLGAPDSQRFQQRGEFPHDLLEAWQAAGMPGWSDLEAVSEVAPAGERDHLRLVADDRQPGSVPR